ncbi:MAG TPA: ATP-binding protein [Candidatus Eremiobacteraeota bacterium]|nr:MAG: serine-protein kinase RsbW [bacterium ADurb.Bin363]HPZ10207.1 ATP-binding protein [Candidatus Eremiobacteraeota bacterium]
MSELYEHRNLLAKISVKSNKKLLSSLAGFVREVAMIEGLKIEEARRLELITDEACLNVIQHAFESNNEAYFDILLERRPGQFVVAIEDKGIPFDWKKVESGKGEGLGMLLIKAFCDEIRFINLGREGKRLELIKGISGKDLSFIKEKDKSLSAREVKDISSISIRFMEPHEGIALAKCFYHVYGSTYLNYIDYPEKIKDLLEEGLQKSIVAVNEEGEILGYGGIKKEKPDSTTGELGRIIICPGYPEEKLIENILKKCIDYAEDTGIYGMYNETFSEDISSQKANLASGGIETGISVGYSDSLLKKKNRSGVIMYYIKVNEEPERIVYPPFEHTTIVKKIYNLGKFRRILKKSMGRAALVNMSDHALVDVKVYSDSGYAVMHVSQYGTDLGDLVRFRLKELCQNNIDCIYIDLPLSDPATCTFCSSLEYLGFFFAGIIPEVYNGDILRLQYLNNVTIEKEKVLLLSDFGKELFNYILRCQGEERI